MADSEVGVTDQNGGTAQVDTETVTTGIGTVKRQVIALADGTANNKASVDSSGNLSVKPSLLNSGGLTTYSAHGLSVGNGLITNTKILVLGAACTLRSMEIWNQAYDYDTWLQFYDSATTGGVTIATTVPKYVARIPLKVGQTAGMFSKDFREDGRIAFASGLVIYASRAEAALTVAPTVGLEVEIGYAQ